MADSRARAPIRHEEQLDSRALELAAGADAVLQHHLVECRDRYLSLDGKLDKLNSLAIRGMCAIIGGLLLILGYLAVHGTQPIVH